jgi:hypothetical protein
MRGHMMEVDLLTLDPKSFKNIQDFFTKFKDLLLQLKACGVDKSKEDFMPPLEPPRRFLLLRNLSNP